MNYYRSELNKLEDYQSISIKLFDFEGNQTNQLTLNKDSIKELETFLNDLKIINDY